MMEIAMSRKIKGGSGKQSLEAFGKSGMEQPVFLDMNVGEIIES